MEQVVLWDNQVPIPSPSPLPVMDGGESSTSLHDGALIGISVSSIMDEGPLKTPIPQCRLYWSFLLRVGKQFCRF